MLIMNILEILRRYTDADHRLSQRDIADILKSDYDMTVDRKSIKRNLTELIEAGYPIEFSESLRRITGKNGNAEESYILSGFYLEREFSDAELRLLIDSLLFSKHIPYSQCKELIEKLKGLSNRYFHSRIRHIRTMPDTLPHNQQLFYTIEILDEAITKGRQVTFSYVHFGTDKQPHPVRDADGIKRYTVNPYQMVATNGRYYLIGNYDKYDDVSHYRLDRITDICLTDTPAKPQNEVKGLKHGLDLPRHMAEHLYMFSGESIPVTFRMPVTLVGDVLDWFGQDITFTDKQDGFIIARVTVNRDAMRHWALQYARHVTVLSPADLAETVKADLQSALTRYEEKMV